MVSLNSQAVAVVTCFHCSKEKHRIANRFVQNDQFLCCVSVYKPPLKATGFNGGGPQMVFGVVMLCRLTELTLYRLQAKRPRCYVKKKKKNYISSRWIDGGAL